MTERKQLPLEIRWQQDVGRNACFVCGLEMNQALGYVTGLDSRDRHSRMCHVWCWTLTLRYAQRVLDEQAKGARA